LGLDVSPHFRFADRNVDSTLIDDISFALIQSEARAVREHCKLLGNWFGYVVQASLGVAAFSALLVKKAMDTKQRDWMTWIRDTSKQAVGSLAAHMWNLLFATLLQSGPEEDPCVYYLINYLVDAVLGCVLSLLLLWGFETMADKYSWDMLRSGDYGQGNQASVWSRWAAQCSLWVGIVTLAKLVLLFCFIVPAKRPLYVAGSWLMSGLINYPRWELVIVMIVIPLVFNVIQFWIQDNWLMNNDDSNAGVNNGGAFPTKGVKAEPPMPPSSSSAVATPAAAAAAADSSVVVSVADPARPAAEESPAVVEKQSLLASN